MAFNCGAESCWESLGKTKVKSEISGEATLAIE